jgi:very-short-patch-repair endonuclease
MPSHSQQTTPNIFARPDFEYHDELAAIFIDGPVHDQQMTQVNDVGVTEQLENEGYRVIRFRFDADWDVIFAQYPDVFGTMNA